jgi:PAS domain-containing protein
MVRFGNVLGSSGSVVPLFRRQIAEGGPITVTHREVTRYFMTIPEAVQLVIQAGAMASGGEVFVLDMGEPVRIVDLAVKMIHLSGRRVKVEDGSDVGIEIQYTGLRPGEKLYEELLIGDAVGSTEHPRIMRAEEASVPMPQLNVALGAMERAEAFLATCPAATFIKDASGRYVFANERFEEALGLAPGGWRGRRDEDLLPAAAATMLRAHDAAVLDEGRSLEFQEIIPGLDGQWISRNAVPIGRSDLAARMSAGNASAGRSAACSSAACTAARTTACGTPSASG